jgi:hypothetical protein
LRLAVKEGMNPKPKIKKLNYRNEECDPGNQPVKAATERFATWQGGFTSTCFSGATIRSQARQEWTS